MQPGPTALRAFRSTEELEIINGYQSLLDPRERCLAYAIARLAHWPRGHQAPLGTHTHDYLGYKAFNMYNMYVFTKINVYKYVLIRYLKSETQAL
jgi:hypothetical protein